MNINNNIEELKEYLQDWDKGEEVLSVEMGGLSHDYDWTIQFIVMEIIRELLDQNITSYEENEYYSFTDKLIQKDVIRSLMSSGSQEDAAQGLAGQYLNWGLSFMLDKAKQECPDRLIYFKKNRSLISQTK